MSGKKRKEAAITPRQARFVAALLTCPTIEAAAAAAGITSRTGRNYLAAPDVRRALSAALDDAMGQATRRAVQAMTGALQTLEEVHTDGEAPTAARVSAARAILEAGPRLREALDLAERVAELEERITGGAR